MKIAVTGASGFVGSRLSFYLHNRGHKMLTIVRSKEKSRFFEHADIATRICDVTDKQSLITAFSEDVEVVIHLAALFNNPEASWKKYRMVNEEGTRNVMEAAIASGVKRVIHCSTVGVATGYSKKPYTEQTPYSPPSWDKYEVTKCEGEKIALSYHKKGGCSVVIIRPSQVYGPGDKSKAKFYRLVKKGVLVNPGKTLKHLIFIDDLCNAFEILSSHEKAGGEIFIIGEKQAIALKDLISIVAGKLQVPSPKVFLPAFPITLLCSTTEIFCNFLRIKPPLFRRSMDFFTRSVEFDVSKAERIIGFKSQVDVTEGVARTAAWYQKNGLL